jgi:hypothetical protein
MWHACAAIFLFIFKGFSFLQRYKSKVKPKSKNKPKKSQYYGSKKARHIAFLCSQIESKSQPIDASLEE